ncbi:DUF2268 domain-containing protein [Brevibacterium atlanticum]|uniref:DUF2268 domain-containing protein n=1 Tax=Brevibacterium atlanticum TaxID=2697563 RepID=UPI001421EB83|nr:DUF2268 domain-containing putative Zn-dependent protease [Brevibacterium atlanticum]
MTVTVIDSASGMQRVLSAPADERADRLRKMWEPMTGMYFFVPDVDMERVHAQSFGFPIQTTDSTQTMLAGALDRLRSADAWDRIRNALEDGIAEIRTADPTLDVPDLRVLIVLGDPNNPHFMDEVAGLSGFGGISGFIAITLWPSPVVLNRLEAIAVHELHHNLRYSPGGIVWDPATVTVGEHVVSEGLADVFAAELYGERGYTHFVSDEIRNDRPVLEKVASGFDIRGMADFAPWVLGDATAELFGATPVGLPTGAGYAAGAQIVRTYLEVTGGSAASNLRTPSADILDVALPGLGLRAER